MKTVYCEGIDKPWSTITLGCWQLAPSGGWGDRCSTQDAEAVVKSALDCGITAFDTAEGYGDGESERRLSKGLGSQKDDVIIISKVWPDAELTLEDYQDRLDNSLRALGRDFVDVYLVHWPAEDFSTQDNSKKLCEIMLALKAQGKIKAIGLSNFQAPDLERLGNQCSEFDINEVPYSLLERQYEGKTLDMCKKSKIGYMSYGPTAKGLLARPLTDEERAIPARQHKAAFSDTLYPQALKVFDEVKAIAQDLGCKPVAVAVAWVVQQDNMLTAIVGSRKPEQVSEFAAAGNLKLSQDHLDRLQKASNTYKAIENGA